MRLCNNTLPEWSFTASPIIAALVPLASFLIVKKHLQYYFYNSNEYTFIGYIQGVQPQHFAGTFHLFIHRDIFLLQFETQRGKFGYFIKHRGYAALVGHEEFLYHYQTHPVVFIGMIKVNSIAFDGGFKFKPCVRTS